MIEHQIAELNRSLTEFERTIAALDEGAFLQPIGRWTARDIVAHLVGWNGYVIEGSKELQRGLLPFYDVDPGENYEKVNAVLIREHPSTDRDLLLEALRGSARALILFLRSLDGEAWTRDYGVRHRGEVVTIRGTVDELVADYDHHRRQIEETIA